MSRHNFSYMLGIYLAVNAIRDAGLVVDGPDCALFKAEYIYGNHDLASTIMSASGTGRIVYTEVDTNSIIMDRSEQILETVESLDCSGELSAILLVGMPMVTLTGMQHDLVLRKAGKRFRAPVWSLPEESLSYDWNDGYAETLSCLAQNMKIPRKRGRKGKVAVVGYFMNRNEPEEVANLRELEKIFEAMNLELVSVWLSGGTIDDLKKVGEAETIVSLPSGRNAAKILSERLGAELMEADLPFGIENTRRFVSEIAMRYGRKKEGERFLDEELSKHIPCLSWAVPHLFLHKRAIYAGPAFYLNGFLDIANTVGIEVVRAAVTSRPEYSRNSVLWPWEPPPLIEFEVDVGNWLGKNSDSSERADLIVGDSYIVSGSRIPHVEMGFPSFYQHSFYEVPYIGVGGAVAFLGRMADRLYEANRLSSTGK